MSQFAARPILALALVVMFLLGTGGIASAGETPTSDPYGSTSSSEPPDNDPSCGFSPSQVSAGQQVTVTINNVPVGETVEIRVGGQTVATSGPVSGGNFRAGPTTSDRVVTFQMPGLPPGTYNVTAVGTTFTRTCSNADGNDSLVLGESGSTTSSTPGGGGDDDDDDGGSLPRTGMAIGGLVLLAIFALAVGRVLTNNSRRRLGKVR